MSNVNYYKLLHFNSCLEPIIGTKTENSKINTYFKPCWTIDNLLVLQINKSAHCTTTIDTKKAV